MKIKRRIWMKNHVEYRLMNFLKIYLIVDKCKILSQYFGATVLFDYKIPCYNYEWCNN